MTELKDDDPGSLKAQTLPLFVRVSIKLTGLPPDAVYDLEACMEKRYREVLAEHGSKHAQTWLRGEASACLAQGISRLVRFFMWT